jgi:two-component system NtrC family sensor kinase
MRLHLGTKLALSFFAVVTVGTLVSTYVGIRLVGNTIIDQAQNKVEHDLNVAWLAYEGRLGSVETVVSLTAQRFFLREVLRDAAGVHDAGGDGEAAGHALRSREELERVRRDNGLDLLTLTDARGRVILRSRLPYITGDDVSADPFVRRALAGRTIAATQVLPAEQLQAEGEGLAEQARIALVPTEKARPRSGTEETAGMALKAAAPVLDTGGNVTGALYGGLLLNRNYELVDTIKQAVYGEERYHGKEVGTATIFQWDLRVSTNVHTDTGQRAIGTRVSESVYEQVLERGEAWTGRAFVVNDWYVTAYEPIRSLTGKIVGMLYVGTLEQPYTDLKNRVVRDILLYSFILSMALAMGFALVLSRRIALPVKRLAAASEEISRGNFDHQVETGARDEIGTLASNFNRMSRSLKKTITEKDRANQNLQELNVRYLELLGFATHELMQPLGVIKGYLTLMRDSETGSLPPDVQRRATLAMLRNVDSLADMSRMYLELSRIESGSLELHRGRVRLYADVIAPLVADTASQAEQRGGRVRVENEEELSRVEVEGDSVLLRVVFANLVSNALKYGKPEEDISVGLGGVTSGCYRLFVFNTGAGIPPDRLESVFDKYVRLDHASRERRGTGLGLFITREIVHLHGGRVWAESDGRSWVRMVVALPVSPGEG